MGMSNQRRRAALAAVSLLSAWGLWACGGGGEEQVARNVAAQMNTASQSPSAEGPVLRLGATRAGESGPLESPRVVAAVSAALVDPATLFDWAEWTYPSLFPKGPQNYALNYQGVAYVVRSYANGNNLGATPAGDIYGLGPFTGDVLQGFGNSASYAAQVQADACKVSPQSCASQACLIDGSTAKYPNGKVCYASLPVPFTCTAAGMQRTASAYLSITGVTSYTYTRVEQCPAGVTVGLASALTTISGTGQASTLTGTAVAATTYAGPEVDGAAALARFYFASSSVDNHAGIVGDGTFLYVADPGHCSIRKVSLASGAVTTLAGAAAGVDHPYGFPCGTSDGTGTAAAFLAPAGVALSPDRGTLYVADGRYLRKIVLATGVVSTLAYPSPRSSATFTNQSTNALDWFRGAIGVAADATSVYVLDAGIDAGAGGAMRLLKLDLASNTVRNVAVTLPVRTRALTLDGNAIYLVGGHVVSRLDLATVTLSSVAGDPNASVSRDGPKDTAGFTLQTEGIVSDGSSLYVTDGATIRQVSIATGVVGTLAGSTAGSADGVGAAARFKFLGGLAWVGGALYAPDNYSALRKIVP